MMECLYRSISAAVGLIITSANSMNKIYDTIVFVVSASWQLAYRCMHIVYLHNRFNNNNLIPFEGVG